MQNVGKWPLAESGKHPVNEDDEENLREAQAMIPGSNSRCRAEGDGHCEKRCVEAIHLCGMLRDGFLRSQ
jgi:hypothetical protein